MGLLFIDRFFLPESLRKHGFGSRLIKMAEEEVARRGCAKAVLFTVHFQAPGFYLRQGYEVLGRLDLDPPGHTRFIMTKMLAITPERISPLDRGLVRWSGAEKLVTPPAGLAFASARGQAPAAARGGHVEGRAFFARTMTQAAGRRTIRMRTLGPQR